MESDNARQASTVISPFDANDCLTSGKVLPKGKIRSKAKATKRTKKGAAAAKKTKARAADYESSLSPEPGAHLEIAVPPADASDAEEDDRLYCICQQIYNPERAMIACDKCDEWYHLTCIHVAEHDVELINDFICPRCEMDTDAKTSWKARCSRPGCNKPAVSLSKYCTDWCGVEVAAQRLDDIKIEGGAARFWPVVLDAQKAVSIVRKPPRSVLRTVDDTQRVVLTLTKQLESLGASRVDVESRLAALDARLRLLMLASKRWELSRQTRPAAELTTVLNPFATGPTKRSKTEKKKLKSTSSSHTAPNDAEELCGFDIRLVWDDCEWEPWAASGELLKEESRPDKAADEGFVCALTRQQCDRHMGWQRLHEAGFQAEKSAQMRRLDRLAAQERVIRLRQTELLEAAGCSSGPNARNV